MSKTDKERNRIQDEFDEIQSENGEFDLSKHLARPEDLPDLGEIEIYDYDADLTVASQQSMDVLESLVDLYLGDVPQLKQHPYIKNKMKVFIKRPSQMVRTIRDIIRVKRKRRILNIIDISSDFSWFPFNRVFVEGIKNIW